jgi:hypothetical protein
LSEIERIYSKQQAARAAVAARSARDRIRKIRDLGDALLANRKAIKQAMWADYR